MRKWVIINFLLLLAFQVVDAQTFIDRAPNGKKNYRAVQGGSELVTVDTVTPLPELIKKLEKPWQFVETGKAYWIGYTDDMYSIATHGDSAIEPLIKFVEHTQDQDAKIGGVYTLHLIGIDRQIVGRFTERFINKNAREALLYLLKYHDLDATVMELLIRDPWLSDVPKLFAILNNEKTSPWYLVNGLLHYELDGIKFNQSIPDDIGKLTVNFPIDYPDTRMRDFGVEAESQLILHSIADLHSRKIRVDSALFGARLWGNMYYPIYGQLIDNKWRITIADFLNKIAIPNNSFGVGMNYGFLENKIYYYVDGNKMTVCAASTAQKILLKWWANQAESYKEQFNQDKAKPAR